MASILNPLNKDDQGQGQQATAGPQQIASGQAATVGAGNAAAPQGTKSGRFNNISTYLKANSGYNAAGGGLAGQVAGNIQNQGNQVKETTNQAQNQFNSSAESNRVKYDGDTVNNAMNNSADFAKDDQNVNKFQSMLNAKYNGPQGIDNAHVIQNQAQNVKNLTDQTSSEGGRFGLLKQMFNKPTYSGGQQKLDNLLLQGNRNQLNKLTGTRQLGAQTVNNVNQATNAATQAAGQFSQEAQDTQAKTRGDLTNAATQFDTDLTAKAQAAQAGRDDKFNQAQLGAQEGYLDSGMVDSAQLGGQNIYDLDISKYLTKNGLGATKQNIAGAQDYDRINALKKLSGDFSNEATSGVFSNFGDASQADKFKNSSDYDLDSARLKNDATSRGSQFTGELADPTARNREADSALTGDLYYKGGIEKALTDSYKGLTDQLNPTDINPLTGQPSGGAWDMYKNSGTGAWGTSNANPLFSRGADAGYIQDLGRQVDAGTMSKSDFNAHVTARTKQTLNGLSGLSGDPLSMELSKYGLEPVAGGQSLATRLGYERGKKSAAQKLMEEINGKYKSSRTLQTTPEGMKFAPKTESGATAIAGVDPMRNVRVG